jgi:hypothetical protein
MRHCRSGIASLILLSILFTVVGCGFSDGPIIGIISLLAGVVFSDATSHPVAGAQVRVLDNKGNSTNQGTTTASDGTFSLQNVKGSGVLVVGTPAAGEELFHLQNSLTVAMGNVAINQALVAAQSNNVTISPTPSNPGGTSAIQTPQSNTTVVGTAGPGSGIFEFSVLGSATPSVGSATSGLHLYVLVNPVRPFAGGWVVQFPEVAVDSTGKYQAGAQIGPAANAGDLFQICTIVTTQQLQRPAGSTPMILDTPYKTPGVVWVSAFSINLMVGTF